MYFFRKMSFCLCYKNHYRQATFRNKIHAKVNMSIWIGHFLRISLTRKRNACKTDSFTVLATNIFLLSYPASLYVLNYNDFYNQVHENILRRNYSYKVFKILFEVPLLSCTINFSLFFFLSLSIKRKQGKCSKFT